MKRPNGFLTCTLLMSLALAGVARAEETMTLTTVPGKDLVKVFGTAVSSVDKKQVGKLWDVLIGADGQPRAAVIDYGGFLGMGKRRIAVPWNSLRFEPGSANPVTLDLTPKQLGLIPDYKDDASTITVGAAAPPQPKP